MTAIKMLALLTLTAHAAVAVTAQDSPQRLLYRSSMAHADQMADWRMEGPGQTTFTDGWMEMSSPNQKGHHVFWCPHDFPDRFVAEWEVRNLNPEAGLCIVFFAAAGPRGQDLFDPALPPRQGVFKSYTHGAITCYHVSYYANAAHNPDRGHANLRRNPGGLLVQQGAQGIPAESVAVHRVRLVRDARHIQLQVDDRQVIDWTDDGEPLGAGKIGLRQMKWTRFRYRNFVVRELPGDSSGERRLRPAAEAAPKHEAPSTAAHRKTGIP